MPWPTSAKPPTIFKSKLLYAFISEFFRHPLLYDSTHPRYKDRSENLKRRVRIARKLGIPGINGYSIKHEIATFKRNYIKRLKEFLQKKKENRPFSAPDWWHLTDKLFREHILDSKPEIKALYLDCLKAGLVSDVTGEARCQKKKSPDKMAGIPKWWNWGAGGAGAGAGVPKGGWGGWQKPEPIDLEAPDKPKPNDPDAQLSEEAMEKKKKELEARGTPVRMTPDGPFPFLIDSHNFRKNHSPEALEPANSKNHWNRLTIIGGAKVPKEKVLDAVVKSGAPHVMMIPALYQTDGDDTFFLFRDGVLISKLMDKCGPNLLIQDSNLERPLEINFMVQYVSVEDEPLNPLAALNNAFSKRLHIKDGEATLDLRNFKNDPEFKNLYVTLKTHKIVTYLVNTLTKTKNYRRLRHLLLSHNDLDRLDAVDHIMTSEKPELKTLDLRHNKLTYSGFERISTLKNWNVHHLLIEGNPICEDYETPGETVYEMKKMMPSIKRLDGVDLEFVLDNRVNFKFYTRNPGFASFVDHFFHHYFTTLETEKDKLVSLYDAKACLSFSVCQNDRTPVPGNFFNPSNRNLISMSNIMKTYENVFIGKTRIFDALSLMPKMKFDTYSFHIDLPHAFQNGTMLISCTGAFTLPDEPSQQVYTFGRACILSSDPNVGCWKIANDMWTMMNALPPPNSKCFKLAKRAVKSDFAVMLNPLTKDKDVLKRVVSDLTHMKSAWVEKYLSDSGWDLECTILSFIDHFKSHLIPFEAFLPFTPPA